MNVKSFVVIVNTFNIILSIYALNHWALNENGKILPKIDSPFYMREPDNLVAFLNQIKHFEIAESAYSDLLRQRWEVVDRMNTLLLLRTEVILEANRILEVCDHTNTLTYPTLTKKYLQRIRTKRKFELLAESSSPHCWKYVKFNVSLYCFDHLESLANTRKLRMEPEEELKDEELEFTSEHFTSSIIAGLESNPTSWKYHTLASYYWRMMGDAYQAAECARRGILHAPLKTKDIPLLSLGTILWRSQHMKDASVVLGAAVDHAPHISDNHLSLGTALGLNYEFNQSILHLEQAEKLDPSIKSTTKHLKQFVQCLENINQKNAKLYGYLEYVKNEVDSLKDMRNKIRSSYDILMQQQVPLGARDLDYGSARAELQNRGQYCSPRALSSTDEPVLFCDFYSELQMRLQSKDVDVEELEKLINLNIDAITEGLPSHFLSSQKYDKLKSESSNKDS